MIMPNWAEIVNKINQDRSISIDTYRRRYLEKLYKKTERNIIIYYSGWLTKKIRNTEINDSDMNGFMNAVHGLDKSIGLDLILHTPGGDPAAAEAIVKYLRNIFSKDIRVIVPHLAMSAGTMIACSAKNIIMGKQSSLGPIDPQFGGIPAFNMLKEFDDAKKELQTNNSNFNYWKLIISKYNRADYYTIKNAIDLSEELITEWLGSCMFDKSIQEEKDKIDVIAKKLNENNDSKYHSRHFDIDWCKEIGLKIIDMEENQDLQDLILSIHHATMITFSLTNSYKIIENHRGTAMVANQNLSINKQKKNA
jgi:ATP-dependent protease ClpP protease subunit